MKADLSGLSLPVRLRILHFIHRDSLQAAHNRTQRRLALIRRIQACAEAGLILVVESGRDCDGIQYSGLARFCEASPAAFDKLHSSIAEWADGPFSLSVEKPSTEIEYRSRDLMLEAFENGHPHLLTPAFSLGAHRLQ